MKYQFAFGEVIRFAETPNNETANLVGKLATITDVCWNMPDWYRTAITGDKWFPAAEFEPVNGGMKSAEESASEPLSFSTRSLCDAVRTLNDDDLESLYAAVQVESEHRDARQQRVLAGAIASAMDAYLRKFGDNRDFDFCGGHGISLQDMHDAIVNEFDLTAQ